MDAGDRRHPQEGTVLAFLARPDQSADYVRRTADFIKEKYPGSAPSMLPKMRAIYRDKIRQQGK
jgi:hypothetical protein